MKKKYIPLILLLITVLAAGTYLIVQKKTPEKTAGSFVSVSPINPTVMPPSLSNTVLSYTNVPTFSFPDRVPYITITSQRTLENETARIASLLNINSTPQTILGSKGKYTIVQAGSSSLTLSENPLTFTYDAASISGGLILYDPKQITAAAIQQLEDLSIFRPPTSVAKTTYSYFSPQGPSPNALRSADGATLVQADFYLQIGTYPIFIGDANTPGFSARFDASKKLIQIRGHILPDLRSEPKEISIISYNEAAARLAANKGTLSSVSTTAEGESFLTGSTPKNIQISTVQLGYIFLPNRNDLVPVFVFFGSGYIEEEKRAVNTTTIVSALP